MIFDPQIVAQAQAFVKGFNSGRGVRVPKMTLRDWPHFIRAVRQVLEQHS
ncbi:succinate dehydrogenase flavoprotein subunit [Pantoea sp. Acro-805]|uniref:Succinate dehydrogenase flavoprotein subunit n=1 Tax=Candidatus Pantoea formicae TaxID=2608355 RepID=A0ABX0R688_9GAMM|nr:succinate dehydrogenase flavoprotein subunit [Pantoea formicae]NIF03533.1 succinate dehydrogenase flavoprotein subunit [Pantoea formicae]